MYIKRNISPWLILRYGWIIILVSLLWSLAVFSAYYYFKWHWLAIPFQPISVIGIAVSFFIGFKNNQSYERFWEGRKIWGAIVNYSRTWANQTMNVVTMDEARDISPEVLQEHRRLLIYRHLAWLHALRLQLRRPTSFSPKENRLIENVFERHNDNEKICETIAPYLSEVENEDLKKRANIATHIIKFQGIHLRELKEKFGAMDGFDFSMQMHCLEECYNFQGKCERIKNTPFPRQYAYFSKLFAYIFALILPLGLLNIFTEQLPPEYVAGSGRLFLLLPISVLLSWIILTWELIGDNSEDPFENRTNDVPMTALTRTIEIDLRDMLDEENLPAKLEPKDNILY